MAGVYVPWLADAARLTGFPVVEVAGWRARGHSGYRVVEGIVAHHTGGPATGEYPSLGVVRDGRADLAGPLSAYGIGRSGTIYVIAAGVSWHAGASRWAGFTDLNDEFLGIEAESSGGGVWTAAQRDVYPRLCAAILHYMRRDASRIGAHREVCLPAGRKPDPTGIDMLALRSQVAFMLGDPLHRIPLNAAPSTSGDDDMFTDDDRRLLRQLNDNLTWTRDQLAEAVGYDARKPPAKIYTRDFLAPREVARGVDLTWVRDQLCTALGIDPNAAPDRTLTPEELAERAPLRRSDLQEIAAEVAALLRAPR